MSTEDLEMNVTSGEAEVIPLKKNEGQSSVMSLKDVSNCYENQWKMTKLNTILILINLGLILWVIINNNKISNNQETTIQENSTKLIDTQQQLIGISDTTKDIKIQLQKLIKRLIYLDTQSMDSIDNQTRINERIELLTNGILNGDLIDKLDGSKLVDSTVTGIKLIDGTISGTKITAGTIDQSKLSFSLSSTSKLNYDNTLSNSYHLFSEIGSISFIASSIRVQITTLDQLTSRSTLLNIFACQFTGNPPSGSNCDGFQYACLSHSFNGGSCDRIYTNRVNSKSFTISWIFEAPQYKLFFQNNDVNDLSVLIKYENLWV